MYGCMCSAFFTQGVHIHTLSSTQVYILLYIHTYIQAQYIYTQSIYTSVHPSIHTCTIHQHIHTYIHAQYIYIYIHTQLLTHSYMSVSIYTYIHIYTYTITHSYMSVYTSPYCLWQNNWNWPNGLSTFTTRKSSQAIDEVSVMLQSAAQTEIAGPPSTSTAAIL
jgi:hypothetical protein